MLNRIVLIGRLTRDPELRYTPGNGVAVATFCIAVDRRFVKEKETDFINIVVWRQQAENCAKFLSKGSLVSVDGRLQIRQYEKDGQRRTAAEVVADSVQFLSPKKQQTGDNDLPGAAADMFDGQVVDEDDVPF